MEGQRLVDAMEASVVMLLGRGVDALNSTKSNHTNPFAQQQTNRTLTNNATSIFISNLLFAESKSVRTSTIILAAFNILAAVATAGSILYDCYYSSKRCNPKFKASKFCISSIHPAETFPLVLAIGIAVQGLVFAGVQGEGLEALFTTGCSKIAQFMWPGLFIVPYLQLVFGLECAFRSFRKLPFQARGKYDVAICCGVVVLMLIATWIPSHLMQQPDTCFASLVWFVTRYAQLALEILSVVGGLMILAAFVIFIRLSTVNLIDQNQRIAASRMVYYLVLGIVSLGFVIPFFGSLIDGPGDIKLSMMATVVLNLSGLMSGLLQLFLRSNTATTSFGPKGGRQWDRKKHDIRIFGPNELNSLQNQIVEPVNGPITPDLESRATSRASLIGPEKGRVISMESLRSPTIRSSKRYEEISMRPLVPENSTATTSAPMARNHTKKPSYSLFPVEGNSPTKQQQPASIYDITDLAPPPSIHYPDGPRHRRDSSIASSATVQIGLRISHAPPPGVDTDALPLPSTVYTERPPVPPITKSQMSLPSTVYAALPLQPTIYTAEPKSLAPKPRAAPPSSPLRIQTNLPSPVFTPRSQPRPIAVNTSASKALEQAPAVNKTLPPTPKAFLSQPDMLQVGVRQSNTQLTPAVYSPEKKTTGLSGIVGGPMSATLPKSNPLRGNPLGSPASPPKRSNSGRNPLSQQQTKADWI